MLVVVGCSAPPAKHVAVPPPRTGCAEELDAAIGRAKTELLPLVPADEAFVLGRPAPAHAVRLRPLLDAVFGKNPGGALTYRVECNANACKVDINHQLAPPAWRRDVDALAQRVPEVVRGTLFVGDTLYVTSAPMGVEAWRETGGDCATREAELRDYDARLDVVRPMRERFADLPAAPEQERIVRAMIHTTGNFEIACRGSICRVRGGIGVELLKDELKGLFDRLVVEHEFERVLWAERRGDTVARGDAIFESVANLDRERVAACKRLLHEPGEIAFELVDEGGAIHAQAIGARATTRAATCLRELIDGALARSKPDGPVQLPKRPLRFWVHSAS